MIEGDFCEIMKKKNSKEIFRDRFFLKSKKFDSFFPLRKMFPLNEKRPCLVQNCSSPQKSQFFPTLN